jgi:hypothetical protein
MSGLWTYMTLLALLAAGAAHAETGARIYHPDSGPDDQMEEQGGAQLTCGEARDLLTRHGYQGVTVRSCFTFAYAFTVECKGQLRQVYVDPENGRIWED